jgi:Ca2+-binding RTX toxin-like protein
VRVRSRLIAAVCVTVAAAAALPSAAGAAETLTVERPVLRDCAAELLAHDAPGAARRSWTAPSSGILTAALAGGTGSDWDLALFSGGEPVAASTSFGPRERATSWVDRGDAVVVQACRRDGGRREIPLTFDLYETPRPGPPSERISMESVAIEGPGELERLADLGLDLTHDVSEGAATVVTYSDAERERIDRSGFARTTLVPDLAAADSAERRAESAVQLRSDLPSGRDSYRQYAGYTSELAALAQENPSLVRRVELGLTLEGRPIEGVEIAVDVLREDDGRPVYLNFGAHHAREWPSAEWPMEFALDLVRAYIDDGDPNHQQAVDILTETRVVIVPVVNVDGFLASRSFGFNPLTDDDPNATLALSAAGVGAYRRKNCRPLTPLEAVIPCALRGSSGVDLNRNYGYYWGGPGSSANATAQNHRGTAPFSEPETEAVHRYTSGIHPTVIITNHTFTTDGKWLRQPGFDASFLPQKVLPGYGSQGCGPQSNGDLGAFTPDEDAMRDLGDEMAAVTGFTSELGYETLCDITGATEDWNYFAQGTYGYTPEARGSNFHPPYATGVATEYVGDALHPGLGVREAYLIAGERAADPTHHSVIAGTAPPGATLKLIKDFEAPTFNQPALNVDEHLETTLKAPADGTYEWHVTPSDRPAVSGGPAPNPGDEVWRMTCQRPGQAVFETTVEVARGQQVTVDWAGACGADPPVNQPPVASFDVSPLSPLPGQQVNLISTSTDPDGAIAATDWDLDDDGVFDDASGLVTTRTFPAGSHRVAVRVTDDDGEAAVASRTIVIAGLAVAEGESERARCRGREATAVGTPGGDFLRGTSGNDVIAGGGGRDRLLGLAGDDLLCGGRGRDTVRGGKGADRLLGGGGHDALSGGPGRDRCRGGAGRDERRSCAR